MTGRDEHPVPPPLEAVARPSRQGALPGEVPISFGSESVLPGHPQAPAEKAQRLGSAVLPFWAPQIQGGKPQSQAQAQSWSGDRTGDSVGAAQPRNMCDGNYRSAWPVGGRGRRGRGSNAEAERCEHAWPEAGAKSHSLWLFMVLEVVVLQVGRGSCLSR